MKTFSSYYTAYMLDIYAPYIREFSLYLGQYVAQGVARLYAEFTMALYTNRNRGRAQ